MIMNKILILCVGILGGAFSANAQDITKDLERLNNVMKNTSKYHLHVSMVYEDKNGNTLDGKQYDLFKVNETKMSKIGTDKMIMNETFYLGISPQNKVIKLLPVSSKTPSSDYSKELIEMKRSGQLDKAIFQKDKEGNKYTISNPNENILKMDFVFASSGFLKKVVYVFNPSIKGNPYANLTIHYEVSTNVSSAENMGLAVSDYLVVKKGQYQLTKAFENYEFINLLED